MYDEEILQELQQTNTYLYQIGQNISVLDNRLITIQSQMNSGDNLFLEQITYTKNFIGIEIIILMTILVYLFIVRSLK